LTFASCSITVEVKDDSAPPFPALVSMPISCKPSSLNNSRIEEPDLALLAQTDPGLLWDPSARSFPSRGRWGPRLPSQIAGI
jgi:hypothetical protein